MVVAFTYLSSYFRQPGVFSHLWSGSVEEQFIPDLASRSCHISTASARRVALCVVVIDPVLRLILAGTRMGQGVNFYFPLLADSIATGCLLALFQPEIQKYRCFFTARWFGVIWALTFAIPLVPYLPHSARLYQCVGLPLLHIGIALCIQNAMLVRYRILNASVPVWIGVVSYSLYLWHVPFAEVPRHVWYTTFPTNISLAFVVAALSYYAVERPVLRFRDREEAGSKSLCNQVHLITRVERMPLLLVGSSHAPSAGKDLAIAGYWYVVADLAGSALDPIPRAVVCGMNVRASASR